jgi:Tfp pilus assembly protein PilX
MRLMQRKNTFSNERGIALIAALFLVVITLVVALAVLANTSISASNSLSVQTKNQAFNAAETGLDTAIYKIDTNNSIASGSTGSATVSGYTYHWEVVQNNIPNSSTTQSSDVDPAYSNPPANTITTAPNQGYLAGWASSITGGRTVYVEAVVVRKQQALSVTDGAIVSGQTAQISHEPITDVSGQHNGSIYAQTITSSGGGQIPDGNSYATCNVAGCNAITGRDGQAHIGAAPPSFLTASQLASIQSGTLVQAKSGGSNVYVNGDWTGSGTWGASGANCVVYINGNVTIGSGTLTNYCSTTVVTGNFTMSGSAKYTIVPVSTSHAMFVLGTGGVTLNGTVNNAGFVYSANGPVVLNGTGTGSMTGVLYSPFNITMNGGATANFYYDPVQDQVNVPTPNVVPVAQWEY